MNTLQPRDDAETLNRKARLRELIDVCFEGKQAELRRHIYMRTGKEPNQAEISQLTRQNNGKSFGDAKAKNLCEAIGLHRRWFDMRLGQCTSREEWLDAKPVAHAGQAIPQLKIAPRHPLQAAAVLQHIQGLASLLGIPMSAIIPDVQAADQRISAALQQQAEAFFVLPRQQEMRVDLSAPASAAPPKGTDELDALVSGSARKPTGTTGSL